jgi:hypothetical protein
MQLSDASDMIGSVTAAGATGLHHTHPLGGHLPRKPLPAEAGATSTIARVKATAKAAVGCAMFLKLPRWRALGLMAMVIEDGIVEDTII